MNWNEWYLTAKKKPTYEWQKQEVRELLAYKLNEHVNEFDFANVHTVLDVGCGDFRMQSLFAGKFYRGIDKVTTGNDITLESTWYNLPDFDLIFCSLTLLTLDEVEASWVLLQMLLQSKWVLLYEETCGKEEKINDDKYHHDYISTFLDRKTAFFDQISTVNPNWRIYLYKGFLQ